MTTPNKHMSQLKKPGKARMARLLKRSAGPIDTSDIPEFKDAADEASRIVRRPGSGQKVPVTIRLDADLVDWFKAQGEGYQTRINDALREHRAALAGENPRDIAAAIERIEALLSMVKRKVS